MDGEPGAQERKSKGPPSLELISFQLELLLSGMHTVNTKMDRMSNEHVEFLVWKERTEGRLNEGSKTMSDTSTQLMLEKQLTAKQFSHLDAIYIKKEQVKWILIGISFASGGVAVAIHRIIQSLGH